jgi:hypothetical protein
MEAGFEREVTIVSGSLSPLKIVMVVNLRAKSRDLIRPRSGSESTKAMGSSQSSQPMMKKGVAESRREVVGPMVARGAQILWCLFSGLRR